MAPTNNVSKGWLRKCIWWVCNPSSDCSIWRVCNPSPDCRICCVQCSLKRISYIFPTKDTTGIFRHTVQFLRNQIYGSLVRVNQHEAKKDYTSTWNLVNCNQKKIIYKKNSERQTKAGNQECYEKLDSTRKSLSLCGHWFIFKINMIVAV